MTAKTIEIRNGNTVTCSGNAQDNGALLATLNQLRTADGVSDVKLEHDSRQIADAILVRFPLRQRRRAMKIENRQQFLVVLTIAVAALFVGEQLHLRAAGELVVGAVANRSPHLRKQVNDGKLLLQREACHPQPLEPDAHQHAAGRHVAGGAAGAQGV